MQLAVTSYVPEATAFPLRVVANNPSAQEAAAPEASCTCGFADAQAEASLLGALPEEAVLYAVSCITGRCRCRNTPR